MGCMDCQKERLQTAIPTEEVYCDSVISSQDKNNNKNKTSRNMDLSHKQCYQHRSVTSRRHSASFSRLASTVLLLIVLQYFVTYTEARPTEGQVGEGHSCHRYHSDDFEAQVNCFRKRTKSSLENDRFIDQIIQILVSTQTQYYFI